MKITELKKAIQNLPECGRIIGHEDFRNAAVLILLFEKNGEYYFLFEKRSKNVSQPGEISFPGGLINKEDKTPIDAALRETEEELGLTCEKIEILGEIGLLYSPLGATINGVVGIADIDSVEDLVINREEVDYVFSVPLKHFIENDPVKYEVVLHAHSYIRDKDGNKIELLPVKDLGLPEMYEGCWGLGKPKVLIYKWKEEIIWGLTARFVFEIIRFAGQTII
jgi:peroxisomal coenzyme A diphosphatase NUDT7